MSAAPRDVTSHTASGPASVRPAAFVTTHWSVVLGAQGESPGAHEALEIFAALIGDLSTASLGEKLSDQRKRKISRRDFSR